MRTTCAAPSALPFDADYYRLQGPIPEGQDALQHYLLDRRSAGAACPLYGFDPRLLPEPVGPEAAAVKGSLCATSSRFGVDDGTSSPSAELESTAWRAMAASQSRLEYFLRREDEARKKRISLLPIRER